MDYWGFALGHADEGTSHRQVIRDLLDLVRLADVDGLSGWFFPEHHGNPAHSLSTSPNLLIAAASQVTRRIRLGTMVAVVPFHHPLRMAQEIRLLDLLTNGRLEVGVGPGGFKEHLYWGVEHDEARETMETGLALLRRLLAGEAFDFDTKWWRGTALTAAPADLCAAPAMWMATVRDQSVEAAARLGLNCLCALAPRFVVARRLELYRDAWRRHQPGAPPGKFGVVVDVTAAETGDEARTLGRSFHERKLSRFQTFFAARPPGFGRTEERRKLDESYSSLSFDDVIEEGLAVCGSVEDCAEQVVRLRTAGVDVLVTWVPFGELDLETVRRSLRLFCTEVIPRVG